MTGRSSTLRILALIFCVAIGIDLVAGATARAEIATDIARCADSRVKTTMLSTTDIAAAESACSRVLAGRIDDADRQKAAFFRGLMRFLQVVQSGMGQGVGKDGVPIFSPPKQTQLRQALADIETAIDLDGPIKGDALALRVTINQVLGHSAQAQADIGKAIAAAPGSVTPYVQRALEHERAGDVTAALADLDHALIIDPAAGTALSARANLLRRLGLLARARADFAAAARLGPPFRRLALIHKSNVELRAGDLKTAYDDLLAAAHESGDMTEAEAAATNADLLARAGDLALDKLKDPAAAEKHFRDAERLADRSWSAVLGLARVAEARGDRTAAIAIYKRILAATETTPKLYERMLASFRLRRLTAPVKHGDSGVFRSAFDIGVTAGKGSPDGVKRVALVIGQGDYRRLASLPNPGRDAAVMANALADMGFDAVEVAENLDTADLRGVPAAIAAKAAQADVMLVFYAGHGVEAAGVNYLIPVDAAPESDRDLKAGALALADIMAAAAKAKRGALVVVDACRDDPFVEARAVAASRAGGSPQSGATPPRLHSGLATVAAVAPNSVVLYSTAPGEAALDGEGLDSPFVRALLETLTTPNQPLEKVVLDTAAAVARTTNGRQRPAAYGIAPTVALLPPAALQ